MAEVLSLVFLCRAFSGDYSRDPEIKIVRDERMAGHSLSVPVIMRIP